MAQSTRPGCTAMQSCLRLSVINIKNRQKLNHLRINDPFSRMFEIGRDLAANIRLHLPQPPVGPLRVAHQHAGFQQ